MNYNAPELDEVIYWTEETFVRTCIKHNFYNAGNNKDYSEIIDFINHTNPTKENIYKVAKNIFDNTESEKPGFTIEYIMFVLINEVAKRFIYIKKDLH